MRRMELILRNWEPTNGWLNEVRTVSLRHQFVISAFSCTGNPTLRLSIAIPFDGVTVTDIQGNIVPNGKIVSLANLTNFCVVSHGGYGKNAI